MNVETAIAITLLGLMIAAAVSLSMISRLFSAVIVFESYSIVMSVVWLLLAAPDLAITEAAVGAGISGILFYVACKRIGALKEAYEADERLQGDV